jgi:hypothetical protein
MADISKHNTEQEGEGHNCEHSRVDFLVHRDTVGINNLLEDLCKSICFDISWGNDSVVLKSFEVCC